MRQGMLRWVGGLLVAAAVVLPSRWAAADNTVKVGVLHSLSGTMAISETSLRDVVLMAVEEINSKGGVMGKQIEPVVVDPASNWPLFAEKAKELIVKDKVAVTFGCWTSVSRKSVLPVFEAKYTKDENPYGGGLLFYPVQYEGEEQSHNVFYTGASPNEQLIPAAEYMMSKDGGQQDQVLSAGHRLRLPPHRQQGAQGVSAEQGGAGGKHRRGIHAVRPQRLSDDRRASRNSPRTAMRASFRRSTATATCRSTRNSPTRA